MSEHMNPGGRIPHVLRAVLETPWAIELPVLAAIRDLVAVRAAGERLTEEEVQARIGDGPARRDSQRVGSVAVLPLWGVITPKADLMSEISGGTSVDRFRSLFLNAVDDREVSAIVMDVSSPGGMTDLIPELAADIRAARGSKPIVAVANTKAASAAYWLATQADELVVTPSGSVGSVGVFAAHDDLSAAMEKVGVKTTLISAGRFKTEGNPYEPLSEEARQAIQERIDEMYSMFTSDVAKGRRVPVGDVRGGFGEGRMLTAKQAVKQGMADSIGTLQQTVERLAGQTQRGRETAAFAAYYVDSNTTAANTTFALYPSVEPAAAIEQAAAAEFAPLSFADQTAQLHDSAAALVERAASLAEVERGHLTVSKRDRLTACTGALRESVTALEQLLADTDPYKPRAALDHALLGDIERRQLAGI